MHSRQYSSVHPSHCEVLQSPERVTIGCSTTLKCIHCELTSIRTSIHVDSNVDSPVLHYEHYWFHQNEFSRIQSPFQCRFTLTVVPPRADSTKSSRPLVHESTITPSRVQIHCITSPQSLHQESTLTASRVHFECTVIPRRPQC